jgi:hypothetical protein
MMVKWRNSGLLYCVRNDTTVSLWIALLRTQRYYENKRSSGIRST